MSAHVVSPKIYIAVFLALLVFTVTTAAVSFVDLGPFNIVVALAIATIKASLVVLFFMHARYIPGRTQLVIIAGIFWLAIMLSLTLTDYTTRAPQPHGPSSQLFSTTHLVRT
jgi:cytochrome c oxidase subunit IV